MHLGIFAKTFARPTLEETLDDVAYHRFTHVQFNMSCAGLPTLPDRIEEDFCRSIARSLRERGITMAAISGTFNLCDPDESRLQDNLRRLDILAAACRWLDTRIVTLCTGTVNAEDMWKHHPDNGRRSAWETLLKSVNAAISIADRHEVTLAFEPEIHNVVSSVMRARKLLDEIGSPWLKVVIDPTNLFTPGEGRPLIELLHEAFDWLEQDIVLAHAKPPQFDKHLDQTGWLPEFLGKEYHEEHQEIQQMVARFARRIDFEQSSPGMLEPIRRRLFFQPYAAALAEIEYKGAVIIHGVEDGDVHDMATLFREDLKISEDSDSEN